MLSVVMAGRNDGYGYMPEERAAHAISLWAQALHGDDELIFVDVNSEGETLPEELIGRGMLSSNAIDILRILKISPETHATLGVSIPMAEYHAKNVGIRNARGDWIIVTNTDDFPIWDYRAIATLPVGFYIVPTVRRIPEVDWATKTTSAEVLEVAGKVHDRGIWKPGDFQMAHRDGWHAVRGYDEDLKDWGYNDSLLVQKAKFLFLHPDLCRVYHLEHKTAESPARGWECMRNIDKHPELVKRGATVNDETWGMTPFEERKVK